VEIKAVVAGNSCFAESNSNQKLTVFLCPSNPIPNHVPRSHGQACNDLELVPKSSDEEEAELVDSVYLSIVSIREF
jgi:hypothetical protein